MVRYVLVVVEFLTYEEECGEDLYSEGRRGLLAGLLHSRRICKWTRKGHCKNAVYGPEHFCPALKPLTVSRRYIAGWNRLLPPTQYAPEELDVALALAAVMCLLGCQGAATAAVALLVSFD